MVSRRPAMLAQQPKRESKREPAAILCVVCQKGIDRPADLAIRGHEVMHLSCYDRTESHRRPLA
jgi:hypothetical protein